MIAQQPIESVDNLSEFIDRTPVLVKLDQSKADNFEFTYKLCSPSRGTSVNLVRDRTNDQMCLYAEKKIHKFHGGKLSKTLLKSVVQICKMTRTCGGSCKSCKE
ncbi:hypothetical protein L596_029462 [Steinernema carpocapsae]|uniref:Uncharacterized protein n=1 Tax=Steinernema carpocapsae TaxID=34508 RepID=A0A4U5LUQ8_STECR|nr:hypothetical protein L596_029462 [Steinernema carpocapsae]